MKTFSRIFASLAIVGGGLVVVAPFATKYLVEATMINVGLVVGIELSKIIKARKNESKRDYTPVRSHSRVREQL